MEKEIHREMYIYTWRGICISRGSVIKIEMDIEKYIYIIYI